MIEQSIFDTLRLDATVASIAGTRIYAMERPQDDPSPAIVFQRVSTTPVTSLEGDSGLDLARVQVACYAETVMQAKQLAAAARAALSALKSVTIMEMDDRDPDTREFRTLFDINVWQK